MSDATIEVPASLDLLDVAGNGMDCERFLWIRALSDPDLPRKARIDLVDDLRRYPGELLHVASKDGTFAATAFTISDPTGAGSCYLTMFCRTDPGEPVLGDMVELARRRALAGGVADVRYGESVDSPIVAAMQQRHGFVEHERWRRFHVDVPRDAALPALPDGIEFTTLADRGDLAAEAYRVCREGLVDTPGDFPRAEEQLDDWLREHDGSPILGRDQVGLLVDGDRVVALVELERLAMGSERAWVEFLAVDRERRGEGLGALAKQSAPSLAARLGITRLQTMNHADNDPICRLNERLGWTEDPVRVALRRAVDEAQ